MLTDRPTEKHSSFPFCPSIFVLALPTNSRGFQQPPTPLLRFAPPLLVDHPPLAVTFSPLPLTFFFSPTFLSPRRGFVPHAGECHDSRLCPHTYITFTRCPTKKNTHLHSFASPNGLFFFSLIALQKLHCEFPFFLVDPILSVFFSDILTGLLLQVATSEGPPPFLCRRPPFFYERFSVMFPFETLGH